ncbi:hypothetical protein, partial [Vibrio vulnificus]
PVFGLGFVVFSVMNFSFKGMHLAHVIPIWKINCQVYPSSRAHLSDSGRTFQKTLPSPTYFGDNAFVIRKRWIGEIVLS